MSTVKTGLTGYVTYRGREGHYMFLLHRFTGLGTLMFLAIHIVDTAFVYFAPHLYPEAKAFQEMPKVFATGYMVGLMEWACIEAMAPHMEPGEGSVGTLVNVTHTAATPPGRLRWPV